MTTDTTPAANAADRPRPVSAVLLGMAAEMLAAPGTPPAATEIAALALRMDGVYDADIRAPLPPLRAYRPYELD